LEGTTAAFREAAIKNTEIRITENITRKIGFVVNGLSPKIGGSSKSLVLGGTKPSPSAPERTNESTRTPIYVAIAYGWPVTGQPYSEKPLPVKSKR
jgi:hypothetical protein